MLEWPAQSLCLDWNDLLGDPWASSVLCSGFNWILSNVNTKTFTVYKSVLVNLKYQRNICLVCDLIKTKLKFLSFSVMIVVEEDEHIHCYCHLVQLYCSLCIWCLHNNDYFGREKLFTSSVAFPSKINVHIKPNK